MHTARHKVSYKFDGSRPRKPWIAQTILGSVAAENLDALVAAVRSKLSERNISATDIHMTLGRR